VLPHLIAGLVTGLGLIVAIGAQNAYVLRQGLARDHVGLVVAICAVSDAVLIVAGTAGMGALIADRPALLTAMRWLGAAYLAWFGFKSLRAARHAGALRDQAAPTASPAAIVTTTLALTWLNPHVYLDTLLMLGNLANQHGATGRWGFAAGAGLASVAWFSGLGFGASALAKPLARPRTWQILDTVIGITMLTLAVVLLAA
jgi:L-lysine exporter family protein LysE/ArgO